VLAKWPNLPFEALLASSAPFGLSKTTESVTLTEISLLFRWIVLIRGSNFSVNGLLSLLCATRAFVLRAPRLAPPLHYFPACSGTIYKLLKEITAS
jgi:hypothetical protein